MKRLFKNDGTLLFGYWINTHWREVPPSYHEWACAKVQDYDLQLERVRKGLDPIPGIKDGTKALPVAKPPIRKQFTSRAVRPVNHITSTESDIHATSMKPKMTREGVLLLIEKGLSRKQIADHFRVRPSSVGEFVKAHGLPKPRDGRKDNKVPEWGRLKGAQAIQTKMANRNRKPSKASLIWDEEFTLHVATLHARGLTWNRIAREINFPEGGGVLCGRYHARLRCLRKNGLPLPQPVPSRPPWWKRVWRALFD